MSALDTIRVGIIGCGGIANGKHMPSLKKVPGVQMVAFCDIIIERAEKAAKQYGTPDAKVFTSIEAMAACPEVDAIYIGTPNTTHCPYTLAAIAAGKHVLCEKPLGCNLDEVERMVGAARAKGVLLMEAMISTLNPFFRALKEEAGP